MVVGLDPMTRTTSVGPSSVRAYATLQTFDVFRNPSSLDLSRIGIGSGTATATATATDSCYALLCPSYGSGDSALPASRQCGWIGQDETCTTSVHLPLVSGEALLCPSGLRLRSAQLPPVKLKQWHGWQRQDAPAPPPPAVHSVDKIVRQTPVSVLCSAAPHFRPSERLHTISRLSLKSQPTWRHGNTTPDRTHFAESYTFASAPC